MSLVLLPAVDVADGQAVRLVQGEAGSETSYGDPLEAALAWQQGGADWVHLVTAMLWVGGVLTLAVVVWPLAPDLRRTAFLRFSRIAVGLA